MPDPEADKMQELRKQLDWELSLDSSELVSHGWYHGPLDRASAEAALQQDGSFLVRDSSTQPGHYVLSCRQGTHFLHFVINRVVIQPDTVYEHFQYQFENEAYDTVPDLVTSYVGSGKPISMASGARITSPSNRMAPLLCCTPGRNTLTKGPTWKTAYCSSNQGSSDSLNKATTPCSPDSIRSEDPRKSNSVYCPSGGNHVANHTAIDKSIIGNQWKTTNKSLSFGEQNMLLSNAYNSLANRTEEFNARKQRSMSLSPGEILGQKGSSADGITKKDDCKESWDPANQDNPPAKPARTQAPIYQASGSDSGNGSGDSAQSSATNDAPLANIPRSASKLTIRRQDMAHAEELLMSTQTIQFKQISVINSDSFRSELFASMDNKPLESDTLQTIKYLLRNSGPMILATHLTRIDLKFVMGSNAAGQNNNPLDKVMGLELCLLAHGDQMRMDIIERAECIKFLIVVTILTCQSDAERADVLNDWIQLAIETKTALGNLFGFSTIMLGLCTKQISSMENVWNMLRQKHTYAAFTFESKLRPSFKNMNDCIDSSPPNTTIPHIMPAIMLLNSAESDKRWEEYGVNAADYGLSVMAAHLEAARKYPEQVLFYDRNAKVALAAIPAPIDDNLLDLFRTEFHVKFLWGARGAQLPHFERHSKLSDIIMTMAGKYLTPASAK